MKIVHIIPSAPYNDYWGYQDNLLPKYHKKLGHEVSIITTNIMHKDGKIVETECTEYFLNDGVRVIRLKKKKYFSRIITNLNSKLPVYKLLKKLDPDFIFFHGLISSTIFETIKFAREKEKRGGKCTIVQDTHLDESNGIKSKHLTSFLIRAYYRFLNKKSSRYVKKIYGVTPGRKKYAEKYFKIPSRLTDLLVMGGDDDKIDFVHQKEIRRNLRKQYNISEEDFLLISGGKIDEKKNIHLLMKAIAQLNVPNIKLMVFGTPNKEMEAIITKLARDEHIYYIGWIEADKVYDYFLASDLAIFPGTHSVLWEQACSCGIPCVFKSWEGMHHVDMGGNCEFLYEDSVEEIERTVLEIERDSQKYKKMLKVAKEKCIKNFSYSEISKRAIGIEE
ncbi:MAG: glycosyltransferase family 4 protein [Christensenellaceae bacterium]|jgi:glycosyltransferase, family 1